MSFATESQSVHMLRFLIMLMACARIATMLKGELRWLQSASTLIASCTQRVSAATATSASTIRLVDRQRKSSKAPPLVTLFPQHLKAVSAPSRNLMRRLLQPNLRLLLTQTNELPTVYAPKLVETKEVTVFIIPKYQQ